MYPVTSIVDEKIGVGDNIAIRPDGKIGKINSHRLNDWPLQAPIELRAGDEVTYDADGGKILSIVRDGQDIYHVKYSEAGNGSDKKEN